MVGKLCLVDDAAVVILRWATLCTILGAWPRGTSAAPLLLQRQTNGVNVAAAAGQPSQTLIVGLAVGLASAVLAAVTAILCFHPKKWVRRSKLQPLKPWINATTTTTITTHSRSGSSESSESSESFSNNEQAPPVAMTRVNTAVVDQNGNRFTNPLVDDLEKDAAGPSTLRPPATLHRYSVHVTSDSGSTTSRRGALSPLPEESGVPKLPTPKATPVTPINWPYDEARGPPPARPGPSRSDLADRRGRPALQSIQVPSPSDSAGASGKGKGKARVYFY